MRQCLRRRGVRRREAFTLVELLVVIGIIAVLIAILMPALGRARQAAQGVACGSNLRQVFLGLRMYADANRGIMPPAGEAFTNPNPQPPSNGPTFWVNWTHFLHRHPFIWNAGSWAPPVDYIKTVRVFKCPGDQRDDPWGSLVGYGMNNYMTWDDPTSVAVNPANGTGYMMMNRVKVPAEMYLMADSLHSYLRCSDDMDPMFKPPLRHNHRASFLFFDGHVELLSPDEIVVCSVNPNHFSYYDLPWKNSRTRPKNPLYMSAYMRR